MAKTSSEVSHTEIFYRFVPASVGAKPYMSELFDCGVSERALLYNSFLYSGLFKISRSGLIHIEDGLDYPQNFFADNLEIKTEQNLSRESAIDLSDDSPYISLIHPGGSIYGHWLIDILPRIFSFASDHPDRDSKFLVLNSIPEWAIALIEEIGIKRDRIIKIDTDQVYFGLQYLVTPTRFHDYLSKRTIALRPVAFHSDNNAQRSLLLARRTKDWRSLENRDFFEATLSSLGYEKIYPEDYTTETQKVIFSGASRVVGESGSAMHNNLFAPSSASFFVVQSSRQNHFIQASLCYLCEQSVNYIWGQAETDDWTSPYKVDIIAVTLALNHT